MAFTSAPLDAATIDARYQAKLDARKTGAAVKFVDPPALPPSSDMSQTAIDARYAAKIARRAKPEPVAPKNDEPKVDAKVDNAPALSDAPPMHSPEPEKGRGARKP